MSMNISEREALAYSVEDGRSTVYGLIAKGVTTRKCSECTTSWTKHERAARWYVRSTLDGCRSGGGRSHVSDVPRAYVYRASPEPPQSTLSSQSLRARTSVGRDRERTIRFR